MINHCPTCGHISSEPTPSVDRMARWVYRRLERQPTGMTRRELHQACSSNDRDSMFEALARLLATEVVVHDGRLFTLTSA